MYLNEKNNIRYISVLCRLNDGCLCNRCKMIFQCAVLF